MSRKYKTLELETEGRVQTIRLRRPAARNALDGTLLRELGEAVGQAEGAREVRVLVLTGSGSTFSAGLDLLWLSREPAPAAALLSGLLERLDRLDKPLICAVNGPAIGGALGLVACADVAVGAREAQLAFAEVRIGLVPAVISPYVLRRGHAGLLRELFLSGERFPAETAREAGLLTRVVEAADLPAVCRSIADRLLLAGPQALAACKELLRRLPEMGREQALAYTTELLTRLSAGEEAQEGIRAFLEKRRPAWQAPASQAPGEASG